MSMKDAPEAASSLAEDLLKEADNLDAIAQTSRVSDAMFSAVDMIGTVGGLFEPQMLPVIWASSSLFGLLSTAAASTEPTTAIIKKFQMDPRWKKIQGDFSNPSETENVTMGIQGEIKELVTMITKDASLTLLEKAAKKYEPGPKGASAAAAASKAAKSTKQIGKLKAFCKSPTNIVGLLSLGSSAYDLNAAVRDVYNQEPTEAAEHFRKCAKRLDELIGKYEKPL